MANRGAALGSELVAELSAFLEKTPRSSLARGPGDGSVDIDSTARDLLFRAGYALEQRGSPSATLAVGYLETLLERDPAHTMAMTVLSRVMFRLGRRAEGVELAGRALATDSTSVDARLLAGELALSTWDWPAARTNLTWAVQHGPGRADTQIQLAYLEGAEGNLDQAARLARTAVRLNPVVPSVRGDIGWLFYYAGELESALEHCSRMLELTPESLGARTCLLLTQLRLGREEEAFGQAGAIAAAEGLDVELPPGASHTTGIEQFLTTAATALVRGSPTPWDRYEAARALALLGREDRALEQLELSVSDGPSLALLYVAVEPAFEALRSNDRFTVLLQNIGLSDLTG